MTTTEMQRLASLMDIERSALTDTELAERVRLTMALRRHLDRKGN